MNSLWFCCDPEPSIDLKACKGIQQTRNTEDASSPFLGIFNEDPADIASRLQRPVTPAPSGCPVETSVVPPCYTKKALKAPSCFSNKPLETALPPATHAPLPLKTFRKHVDDLKPFDSIVCESPPTHGPFDFSTDSLKTECAIFF
ncbi:hypothetical protein M9Y10_011638 [Tritrichomonas musculus]|uniref:Uncharacterized protein n=1 Tax=Tritrichomonas musculus TaxID=1915356 RepID=A0ABR2GJ89_9EUKA